MRRRHVRVRTDDRSIRTLPLQPVPEGQRFGVHGGRRRAAQRIPAANVDRHVIDLPDSDHSILRPAKKPTDSVQVSCRCYNVSRVTFVNETFVSGCTSGSGN